MKKLMIVLLLCAVSRILCANDAPIVMVGTTATPVLCADIQMVSERIEIRLNRYTSQVHCTFHFKNSGEPKRVLMGFPQKGTYLETSVMENFTTTIKGKDIPVECVTGEKKWAHWNIWSVDFGEDEELTIINTYDLGQAVATPKGIFAYVLETGRGWKGEIERSEIIVTLGDLDFSEIGSLTPYSYVVGDSGLFWTFEHYEPDSSHNIHILYRLREDYYFSYKWDLGRDFPKLTSEQSKLYIFDSIMRCFLFGEYKQVMKVTQWFRENTLLPDTSRSWRYAMYFDGVAYKKLEEYKKALRCFSIAGIKTDDYNTFLEQARIYERIGEIDRAIGLYQQAQIPFHRAEFAKFLEQEKLFYSQRTIEEYVVPYLQNDGLNAYCCYKIGKLQKEAVGKNK